MASPIAVIYLALSLFAVSYAALFVRGVRGAPPSWEHLLTGLVTNFFDTLGIGSFATTTAIFKFRSLVPDRLIPGTMNAGHTLPTMFQAFIYITAIAVDPTTLILLIAAAVLGAWFGAGLVAGLSRRVVSTAMAGALLFAAAAMLMRQFNLFPVGGEALELRGWKLLLGVVGNLCFGAITTLGIGFYAPCITMVSLLGLNPAASFPIMMGSSAFLMPVASAQFIRRRALSPAVALGLTLGGLAGVPLAAFVVQSLPLNELRWLVIVVVLYTAVLMLKSGVTECE